MDIGNLNILHYNLHMRQAKTLFVSSYYLSGRVHRFLRKSTLYINGLSNSEKFDLICLDYAYQIAKSVISHRKHKDNKYIFNH